MATSLYALRIAVRCLRARRAQRLLRCLLCRLLLCLCRRCGQRLHGGASSVRVGACLPKDGCLDQHANNDQGRKSYDQEKAGHVDNSKTNSCKQRAQKRRERQQIATFTKRTASITVLLLLLPVATSRLSSLSSRRGNC